MWHPAFYETGSGQAPFYPGASLALDFAAGRYRGSASGPIVSDPSLVSGWSYTRTGAGTAEDTSGVYASFATNLPRRTNKGLLVEEARTNLLLWSQEFDNAAWTKTGSTITPNATLAPDGTLTADKLVETSASSTHVVAQTYTFTAAAHTVSVFAKAGERNFALLSLANTTFVASINLTTGAVAIVQGAGPTVTADRAANGWWRVNLTGAPSAGSQAVNIYASQDGVFANRSYLGDGVSGIYIWQADLSLGSYPTSPILTTGAAATRGADGAVATVAQPAAFTMFAEVDLPAADGTDRRLLSWSAAGSGNNRVGLLRSSSNGAGVFAVAGGVTVYSVNTSAGSKTGARVLKLALSFDGAVYRGAADGASLGANPGAAPVGLDRLDIGAFQGGGTNYANGFIRKAVIYPRAFSDAELQALTA